MARLAKDEVRRIRALAGYLEQGEIARMFNVNVATVSRIVRYESHPLKRIEWLREIRQ